MLVDGRRSRGPFAWDEVEEIVTFKCSLGIVDDIRLAFRASDGWIEVSEEDEGWADLRDAVARHYPAVPSDWLKTVMFPPFATNERVLYRRDGPADAADPAR